MSFCQKWPLSTYIHCRLGRCKRPLETFNRLFTLLRVIPEQRRVDVFSSYWTDGYDQDVWQVVKIHMKLKKSCVDQTLMKVFPKSVFVLLPGIQDVANLPINDEMPFYFHVRVFAPANCVSFSVPEMNFWQCICFVRSVAVQLKMFVENIYTEVTENFLSCVFFFTVFFNQRFSAVIIFILAERFPFHAIPTPLPLNSEEHKIFHLIRATLEK